MNDQSVSELRTQGGTPLEAVYFDASPGLDDPQTMLLALRGIVMALNDQPLSTEMEYADITRLGGLTAAATILSHQLCERLRFVPAGGVL